MHYSTLLAILSAPLLARAQSGSNPFDVPDGGFSATGGVPITLNWNPTTDGTITLVLRSGNSNDLNEGTVIASEQANTGSYTWVPSDSITRGGDYTVEIVDDTDPSNTNYTPKFFLDTDTTEPQVTSIVSLGQPMTTLDLSTASPTGRATTLTEVLATSTPTTTVEDVATMTSGNSAASTDDSTMMTSASSATNAAESSAASAAASASAAGSSAAASASSDLTAPQQTGNAGSRNTAMVGMLGAVALGAFAL